jgi:hypothetical protein
MTYTIKEISNGWLLHFNDAEDIPRTLAFSYEEEANREEQCKAFQSLLWELSNNTFIYSKHEECNVKIEIEKIKQK